MGGPGWGVFWGLTWAAFWVAVILIAVWLLRGELPRLQHRFGEPPALRLLEERYARGEISREEFLERREVLLQPSSTQEVPGSPPPGGPPAEDSSGPTQPIPPSEPSP
ncbi:MAG TPA: SHOCT domain-containing protein [Actinomycetota bacterium]